MKRSNDAWNVFRHVAVCFDCVSLNKNNTTTVSWFKVDAALTFTFVGGAHGGTVIYKKVALSSFVGKNFFFILFVGFQSVQDRYESR